MILIKSPMTLRVENQAWLESTRIGPVLALVMQVSSQTQQHGSYRNHGLGFSGKAGGLRSTELAKSYNQLYLDVKLC